MITQTVALFVDAYRELNARKLFWITLMLSGLVVLIYAAIGIDQKGITFLWFHLTFLPIDSTQLPPELLYKTVFMNLGLGIWLTWIATILALISTAGIVPDMISGGSIEMLLSKPISRTRLFLTKYVTGLLFVTLQVAVFTVASFLVIGVRGGSWEPGLLLAIPIVVCFFSYLFGFCALVGVLTRSTIASLLITLLFWFLLFVLNAADAIMVTFQTQAELQRDALVEQADRTRAAATKMLAARKRNAGEKVPDDYRPTDEEIGGVLRSFPTTLQRIEEAEASVDGFRPWMRALMAVKTVLPKTGETIAVLERTLISMADLELMSNIGADEEETEPSSDLSADEESEEVRISDEEKNIALQEKFRKRSVAWVIGTSLGFEVLVVGLGVLIFVRRDP